MANGNQQPGITGKAEEVSPLHRLRSIFGGGPEPLPTSRGPGNFSDQIREDAARAWQLLQQRIARGMPEEQAWMLHNAEAMQRKAMDAQLGRGREMSPEDADRFNRAGGRLTERVSQMGRYGQAAARQ